MALPKAAQKQIEDAEALHAEVYANESVKPDEQAPTEPAGDAPAEPTAEDGDAPAAEPPAEAPAPVQEVPTAQRSSEEETAHWRHKYDVLKGKYDAEVPRLAQDNNALRGRVSDLEAQMAAQSQQMLETTAAGATPTGEKLLSADEIEDYGPDMIDVVKRAAREEFAPIIQQLQTENANLRSIMGGMQQQSTQNVREAMFDRLDADVPNWREINGNQEFLGWLENVDPYSGHKKLDMLRQAFEQNNAPRVLAFFKGFLNENAAFASRQEPSPAQPQVSLDTLVAPGRPSEGNDTRAREGNGVAGRNWSQADIAQYYRDVQRGVYRNDPEEAARLEADIFLAQKEGRIT